MTKREKDWHQSRAEIRKAIRALEVERDAAKDRLVRITAACGGLDEAEAVLRKIADEENNSPDSKYKQRVYSLAIAVIITPEWNHQQTYIGQWIINLKDRIKDNEIDIANLRMKLEEGK
jgi:hypothetical protein